MIDQDSEDVSYEDNIKQFRENRHKKLLNESANVFSKTGIARISMDTVAKEIGVSKVVLYRYFKSKDALINEILSNIVDLISTSDGAEVTWGPNIVAKNLQTVRQNQSAFQLMMRHTRQDPTFGHHYQRLSNELIEHTVSRISKRYVDHRDAISVRYIATQLCAFIFDSIGSWIDSGKAEDDAEFVNWLVDSLRALAEVWAANK